MRVEAGVATDIGRVRERNEDSFLVEPPLYAVADGMGGHRGGAVASELALEKIEERFGRGDVGLAVLVQAANRAVFERSMTDRRVTGMGTTLTAAVVDEDGAHLAHVGDSRAYLLRGGALRQLTEDHTLVNRMVRAGEISREEAEVHPHRNVLTRALGTEAEVDVDEQDVPLMEGDRLLLCSDGLTGMVAEDQIQAILEATPRPQEAADRLIKAANRAGGIDNITVVVLGVLDDEGTRDDTGAQGTARGSYSSLRSSESPLRGRPSPLRRLSRPNRAAIRRWAIGVGVAALIGLVVFFGGRAYIDRQWYVGEARGHVAVYQGIPAELGGLRFSHVELETDIPADQVVRLAQYQGLPDGITANDRSGALAIVEQMRTDVKAAATGGAP